MLPELSRGFGAVPRIRSRGAERCAGMFLFLAFLIADLPAGLFLCLSHSMSLVLHLVKHCPDLYQDNCPTVWAGNCLLLEAAFVITMKHVCYQTHSRRAEHWTGMGTQMVLATEMK